MFWHGRACRLLLGQEKLFLQGIQVEDDQCTDAELGDLAGNAFCVTQCVQCILVAFFGLSLGSNNVEEPRVDFPWQTLLA